MADLSGQTRLSRIRQARNRAAPPADFEDFWQRTLEQLDCIEPEVQSSALRTGDEATTIAADLRSWEGATVRCWLSGPRRDREAPSGRPLLVTAHGYGGQVAPERVRRLARFGMDVVGVDIRGCGISRDAVEGVSPYGYVLTGHESAKKSILRGAVCDYLQAYRAARDWFGRPSRVTFQGFSFAGGLATMAAGVLGIGGSPSFAPPNLLAIGVPTFGHHHRRLALCESGSGQEIIDYLRVHPEKRGHIERLFSYFDTTFFAPFVGGEGDVSQRTTVEVLAGVGLYDPVVPPETVYAIFNALPRKPRIFELPCSHTSRPEEAEWVRWESAWIRAARRPQQRPNTQQPVKGSSEAASAQARASDSEQ